MLILIVRNDDCHITIPTDTLCKDGVELTKEVNPLDFMSTYPTILIPKKTPCTNSTDITFWSD